MNCFIRGIKAHEMTLPRTLTGSDSNNGPMHKITSSGNSVDTKPANWVLQPVVSCIIVLGGAWVETKHPKKELIMFCILFANNSWSTSISYLDRQKTHVQVGLQFNVTQNSVNSLLIYILVGLQLFYVINWLTADKLMMFY